jgi:hypothetical protein
MNKRILYIIILVQLALIVSIQAVNYQYRQSGSDAWINRGYFIMSHLWVPITFSVFTLLVAIFIKEPKTLRVVAALLAFAGFLIFNKVYLYPF